MALTSSTRYLASADTALIGYFRRAPRHAGPSCVEEADLTLVQLLVGSLGD